MNEQLQKLNKIIDNLLCGRSRIDTVQSLLSTLIIAESSIYEQTKEENERYKELSAEYVSHLLNGNDSLCERYKCRDAFDDYKDMAKLYMDCVLDIKWLIDELAALRIVELCRTGL